MEKKRNTAPCPACAKRHWKTVDGFLVLHCGRNGKRFGIEADIKRGYVNKAGGCVAMPESCEG